MSSSPQTTERKRPFISVWTVVGLAVLALVWFFGIGDATPSRQYAEKFLAWGFVQESDGIPGFREDGTERRIKSEMVNGIDEVECHRDTSNSTFFQRHPGGFKRYDCIYRLGGTAGEKYLLAIAATYMPKDQYDLTQVDPYMLTFWAANPDQRRILTHYGINIPKPSS